MSLERSDTHVEQLIGVQDNGTFVFLDRVFTNGSHEGATGTRMRPVTKDDYDRRVERYKDRDESPLAFIYEEEAPDESWDDWIEPVIRHDDPVIDDSYVCEYGGTVRELAPKVIDHIDEVHRVECIGGGRMFSGDLDLSEWQHVENEHLAEVARIAESDGYDAAVAALE